MTFKRLRSLLPLLLMAFAATACSGGGGDDNGGSSGNGGGSKDNSTIRRTVIMYVDAQNSLGYNQYNLLDSAEMMAGAQYLNARDQFLLYVDDDQLPRVYRIYKGSGRPQLVRSYDSDVDSSDPATLKELLQWVKGRYPSESYGLVMWSHANGWLPSWNDYFSSLPSRPDTKSFGLDVGPGGDMENDVDSRGIPGSTMDVDDLAQAVSESGVHPAFIFFDACQMQCIEVDYALRNVTDYIIAAPIATPAIGPNYTSLFRDGLFASDPSHIAISYYTYMSHLPKDDIYNDFGMVISCVKTSELETLAAATRKLVAKYAARYADGDSTKTIWPNVSGATQYYIYDDDDNFASPHFYDLAGAMRKLLPEADYAEWSKVLDQCIVYKAATDSFYVDEDAMLPVYKPYYCAISAFIPQQSYARNGRRLIYGDFNECFRATEWYEAAGWKDAGW